MPFGLYSFGLDVMKKFKKENLCSLLTLEEINACTISLTMMPFLLLLQLASRKLLESGKL